MDQTCCSDLNLWESISVQRIFKNTQLKLFEVFKLFGRKHEVPSQANASVYGEHSLFSEMLNALQIFFFKFCSLCMKGPVFSAGLSHNWYFLELVCPKEHFIHFWGWKEDIVHWMPMLRVLECLWMENLQTDMLGGIRFLPFLAEKKRAQYTRKILLQAREMIGRASCQCEGPHFLIPIIHVWKNL